MLGERRISLFLSNKMFIETFHAFLDAFLDNNPYAYGFGP